MLGVTTECTANELSGKLGSVKSSFVNEEAR